MGAQGGGNPGAASRVSALVAALSASNPVNRVWWYSWLSSRDIFNSRLLRRLEGDQGPARNLARALAAEVRSLLLNWWRCRRLPAVAPEIVFVTLLEKTSAATAGKGFRDSYFGDLPRLWAEKGMRVLVTGQVNGPAGDIVPLLRREADVALRPFAAWSRPVDVMRALAVAVRDFASLRQAGERELWRQAKADILSTLPATLRSLAMEFALARLLRAHPGCRLIQLCENNPWERAAVFAARRLGSVRPRVVGYVHNPIMPDNPKITATPEEWALRPDPDVLLCTGPAAVEALAAMGGYPRERLRSACALRLPAADGLPPLVRRGDVASVLVLLSGLPAMADLVRWLHEAAAHLGPRVAIRLRGHPNRPVEQLAALAGVPLPPHPGARLEVSAGASLAQDLAASDAVIYKSSGSAFAAGSLGLPLLYFAGDETMSADPLFRRPELRLELRRPEDLAAAIAQLDGRSTRERERLALELSSFAQECMTSPSQETMDVFLTA